MKKIFFIGFDLGTSNIKGVLVDDSLTVAARAKVKATFPERQNGYKEIDPEDHFESVCHMITQLTSVIPTGSTVKAICFSGATGNTLLLDNNNTPLTNIISWLDKRPVQTLFTVEEVYPVSGWPRVESFPLAHLSWQKQHNAAVYKKAQRIVMNNDYITFRLTGKFALDYSTASTFHLFNQLEKCWHTPFLDRLEIHEEQLSSLIPSGSVIGSLTDEAAERTGLSSETSVVAGSFDHPAAARAVGVVNSGDLLLSCGTSWVGFYPVMDRKTALSQHMHIDPFLAYESGPWGAIFSFSKIGIAIDWWIDSLAEFCGIAADEKFMFFDNEAAAGTAKVDGLTVDPACFFEQNPEENRAILRQNLVKNVARAVMEDAAILLQNRIKELSNDGITADHITMVGGPANSRVWPGIISDITGLDIHLQDGEYAGAVGAAKLAMSKRNTSHRSLEYDKGKMVQGDSHWRRSPVATARCLWNHCGESAHDVSC